MSDVGKRSTVNEGRVAFEGLGDVGQEGLPKQQGHGTGTPNVFRLDGVALGGRPHHDFTQSLSQVSVIGGEHEDGHHFAGCGNVESVFANVAVGRSALADGDVAKRTVVHVDDTRP